MKQNYRKHVGSSFCISGTTHDSFTATEVLQYSCIETVDRYCTSSSSSRRRAEQHPQHHLQEDFVAANNDPTCRNVSVQEVQELAAAVIPEVAAIISSALLETSDVIAAPF